MEVVVSSRVRCRRLSTSGIRTNYAARFGAPDRRVASFRCLFLTPVGFFFGAGGRRRRVAVQGAAAGARGCEPDV